MEKLSLEAVLKIGSWMRRGWLGPELAVDERKERTKGYSYEEEALKLRPTVSKKTVWLPNNLQNCRDIKDRERPYRAQYKDLCDTYR